MSRCCRSPLMLGVILAAGRGSRLGPLTIRRSKAMMPVAGTPMVGRVLTMLVEGGVDRVVVVVHPDDRELIDYLRQPPRAARIRLAHQRQRLGMAHAVACASPVIRPMDVLDFVLASCDNLYPEGHVAALVEHRREQKLDAALTFLQASRQETAASATPNLHEGLVTGIIEKPDPAEIPSYGSEGSALSIPSLYALSVGVLDYVDRVKPSDRGELEFPDALNLLIADGGRVGGRQVSSRMTLTNPRDLVKINRRFLRREPSCAVVEGEVADDATIVPPVRIDAGAVAASGCRIGPEAYLEGGCRVNRNAVVRRAVVLRDGSVGAGDLVEESVVSRGGQTPGGRTGAEKKPHGDTQGPSHVV